jgi:8-oxo-dGTP pyrophosphatase MutT (NUDIX family)
MTGELPRGSAPRIGALRARYVRRVTREHVGSRVSVRYLVDEPGRGPTATDLVARLLALDPDAMLLVDREGQLHVVDPTTVVASRPVPAHPRLPPEPDVGRRRDEPLVRDAARVLLLDGADRVLLVAHVPSAGRRVWTAPGGGLRPGEDHAAAARRELVEELGVDVPLGPWVFTRRELFTFRGVWLDQSERWFLARVDALDVDAVPLDDPATDQARWWTLPELDATDELLAPTNLADETRGLLRHGPPDPPRRLGR